MTALQPTATTAPVLGAPRPRVDLLRAPTPARIAPMLATHLAELGASAVYPYLPLYWADPARHPYELVVDGAVAGFALVRWHEGSWDMAEFHVLPAWRRQGVGRAGVDAVLAAHPGDWEVRVHPGSATALAFWRAALPGTAAGRDAPGGVFRLHVPSDELARQRLFLDEMERLKLVDRRNLTLGGARPENSAEHSWHVALMAWVLADHAQPGGLDLLRVIQMLLIHDVVKIDAGDTWAYAAGPETERQSVAEEAAAVRLFGLLPEPAAGRMLALWREFEAGRSPEAAYAKAIDALQPLLNHERTGDPEAAARDAARPTLDAVLARKRHIAGSAPTLWSLAKAVAERGAERGLYARPTD